MLHLLGRLNQINSKSTQMLVFGERGRPEYPEKKHLGTEQRSNKLSPPMTPSQGIELGGRGALLPLRQHWGAENICICRFYLIMHRRRQKVVRAKKRTGRNDIYVGIWWESLHITYTDCTLTCTMNTTTSVYKCDGCWDAFTCTASYIYSSLFDSSCLECTTCIKARIYRSFRSVWITCQSYFPTPCCVEINTIIFKKVTTFLNL